MTLMRTTTFVVNLPIDTQHIDEQFLLVRYDVPMAFHHSKAAKKFARLHTQVRAQIRQPYRFYTHDKLGPSHYAIYVLYQRTEAVRDLELPFLNIKALQRREVSFGQLELHMIIKLLQAQYFGRQDSPRFTSQGKHFIQAKVGERQSTCLEVEITGDIQNNEIEGPQILKVAGHAARFVLADPAKITTFSLHVDDYFQKLSPKHGQVVLTYVPPNQVERCTQPLYRLRRDPARRATLDYHSVSDYRHTRGYLLYHFVDNFLEYLNNFGLGAYQQLRSFTAHPADLRRAAPRPAGNAAVCLLDLRLNRTHVPLAAYHALLQGAFPEYTFEPTESIQAADRRPILILLDADADDFAPGGILAGKQDPYQHLYRDPDYRDWPKQSINVNSNDPDSAATPEAYLTYPPCTFDDDDKERFRLRFQVCLNELMLKDLILNNKLVAGRLPYLTAPEQTASVSTTMPLQGYAFLRRETFKGTSYRTVLYFHNNRLVFLDLRAPDDKVRFDALLANFELDVEQDIEGPWRAKYRKEMPTDEEPIKTPYHFILGPGQVIEIEDCKEHVLYEYDLIEERRQAVNQPLAMSAFKLAPFYDDLRPQSLLSLAQLAAIRQTMSANGAPSEKAQASQAFLDRLEAFDAFLAELMAHRQSITFNDLTSGENVERIANIFGLQPTPPQTGPRAYLKRLYQRLGMFPSEKARDIQHYQGIWYDDEGCFMVGSPEQLKFTQPRAHLIRKFHVYPGKEQFQIEPFLDTLAVTFVRPEQYTVYPYPFHLIDIYVEAKLSWAPDPNIVPT